MKRIKFNNKGFSLVEVLVAIVVITIAASAILSGFVQASRVNLKSQRMQDATNLAQITAELFNSKKISDLIKKYSSAGYAAEGIDVIDSGDDGKGVRTIEFKNIKEEYIYNGRTYDEDFKVDITLDSTRYAATNSINSTYNQEVKLSQANADGKDTVVSNTFMVPVMKETGNNLIISSEECNDSTALSLYKSDVESAFITAYTSRLPVSATSAQRTEAANRAVTDADAYIASKYPSSNIIQLEAIGPSRELDLHITCDNDASYGYAKVSAYVTGTYVFPTVASSANMYNVSIPEKRYTDVSVIPENTKSFSFNKADGTGLQDVYFYISPINGFNYYRSSSQYTDAATSKDKVRVVFNQNATGVASTTKINCYVIAQNFKRKINPTDSNYVICTPVFHGGDFSITSGSTMIKVYNNFQKIVSGKLVEYDTNRTALYGGYITDGGSNNVAIYDMTIRVYLDGNEYAVIQTTKED